MTLQTQVHVVEALVGTMCGVAGIRSSLMHSPAMLLSGLQLLLVVLRLSTAACEAAIGSSFPQVCSFPLPDKKVSATGCCLVVFASPLLAETVTSPMVETH